MLTIQQYDLYSSHLKRFFGATIFLLLFFISFSSSAFAATDSQESFIVAKVNNKAITNSELNDRYLFVIKSAKITVRNEQERKLLTSQILDKMIDEELIIQEAEKLKISASGDDIREAVDILAFQEKKNATQLKLSFIKNGLSFDNYLKQIESEILWSKIISEVLRPKVKVTDVEVKEFFEQHKFNTNIEKFLISEVVISSSERASNLANKLSFELKQGADFENIVRQFSSSFTSENNGQIGWVSKGDIDPKIYSAISKLGKGGYSEPVLLSDGYHIFKLLDIRIENKIAEQDMDAARNAVFSKKLQSLAKGYLMDMRKNAFVEIS